MSRLIALVLLAIPVLSHAQSRDSDFHSLMKDRKFTEADALARERIAKNAKDDLALWYLARINAGNAKTRDDLIAKLEQCTAAMPQSARCHHGLGTLYGAAALSGGMTSILKYGSRVKDEFVRAVELEPSFYDARRDLGQFYLQAPGIAGGSVSKAIANADAMKSIQPNMASLLRADVHIYEKEFDKAESLLNSVKPGADETVAEALAQSWSSLGVAMINDKQPGKAVKLFERRIAADMNNAVAYLGLGRAQLEANLIDAAIASLERAQQLNDKIGAHYRLGIAYQTKGDIVRAFAAFKQFLGYQPTGRAADDARTRLAQLEKR
jgi:tetratricopeptide (TPR) repeat protein